MYHGFVADLEAIAGRDEDALDSVDAGLVIAKDTGEDWTDPLLLWRKGQILLQTNSADPTPAERAFWSALENAKKQGSRSFGLRAALSLAKLYQSTDRPIAGHTVLVPPLETFSPTPEMPEISETLALLGELA